MKSFLFILFSLFTAHSFSQTIINDKNAEVRNVGSFSEIQVSGGIDVYLSQSDNHALAVSASDAKDRDQIKTEVKNGVLNIYFDPGPFRFNSSRKLRAYVSFKTLESLAASGACDFIINGIYKQTSAKIKLTGACSIKGKIDLQNLQLDLTGASSSKMDGTVANLKINAVGASDVKNYDLIADNCIADISGASDVKITVNQSLSVKATGASSFFYKGNPQKKEVSSSGASSVSQRD